jgi:hypothetical protein
VANPAGRPPFNYQTYEFEDQAGNIYSINFTGTGTLVALVYKIEKGRRSKDVDQAIQLSLESLAVDADAGAARGIYQQRGGRISAPPPQVPGT